MEGVVRSVTEGIGSCGFEGQRVRKDQNVSLIDTVVDVTTNSS